MTSVYVPADVEVTSTSSLPAAVNSWSKSPIVAPRGVADLHGEVDAPLIDAHAQVLVGVERRADDVRLAARERAFHRLHPRRRRVLAERGRTAPKTGQ